MGKVDLSTVIQNLKMDTSTVDTGMAKVYLEAHQEIHSDSSIQPYPSESVRLCFGSKIFCLPHDTVSDLYIQYLPPIQNELLQVRSDRLKKLTSEIEKNSDLICQLEFLMRNVPVRETKVSIRLIVQHLLYLSENMVISREEITFMEKNTPLLALGCVLQSLKLSEFIYMFATSETAMICCLFTELCQKVGLDCVKLVIAELTQSVGLTLQTYSSLFNDYSPEVLGVITDKSDMDSAVDVFLNSEHSPFPLTRIYVQESLYKDFKDVITWKCRTQQCNNLSLKPNSTDAFKYGTKTIYLDYAGIVEEINNQNDHLIFVEAYRTTNELLSLLSKMQKPLCLSLWSSGIAEANEISLNVNIPIVWINDYYNFDGPDAVSQAIFDKTYQSTPYNCEEQDLKNLMQKQKAWAALNLNQRYQKVVKAFDFADNKLGDAIKEMNMAYWKLGEFISVKNKAMIFGITSSTPMLGFIWGTESNQKDHKQVWLRVARALINGSALAYWVQAGDKESVLGVFGKLAKCGVPVADLDAEDSPYGKPTVLYKYYPESAQTKVIWTSFGTTFAN